LGDALHFIDETLQVFKTVLSTFNFVDDRDNSTFEDVMAFAVWYGYNLFAVVFAVRLSDLTVGGG
jgi:hypothetical protein